MNGASHPPPSTTFAAAAGGAFVGAVVGALAAGALMNGDGDGQASLQIEEPETVAVVVEDQRPEVD